MEDKIWIRRKEIPKDVYAGYAMSWLINIGDLEETCNVTAYRRVWYSGEIDRDEVVPVLDGERTIVCSSEYEALNWFKPDYKPIPEKWCIKLDRPEVVDYCNKNGANKGFYVLGLLYAHFPSFKSRNTGDPCTTSDIIKEEYTEISFDDFKKHILNMEKETIQVKTELVKKVYNLVCDGWKSKISAVLEGKNLLLDTVEVDKSWLKDALEVAKSEKQSAYDLLTKEIPELKDKSIDLSRKGSDLLYGPAGSDAMIRIRIAYEYRDKSFYLDSKYNWELTKDKAGVNVLIPTLKW